MLGHLSPHMQAKTPWSNLKFDTPESAENITKKAVPRSQASHAKPNKKKPVNANPNKQTEAEVAKKPVANSAWTNLNLTNEQKQEKKQEKPKQEQKHEENSQTWNEIQNLLNQSNDANKETENKQGKAENNTRKQKQHRPKQNQQQKKAEEPKVNSWATIEGTYDDSKDVHKIPVELRRSHNKQNENAAPKQQQKQKAKQQVKKQEKPKKKQVQETQNVQIQQPEQEAAPVEEPKINSWATIDGTYDDSKDLHKIPVELRRSHVKQTEEEKKPKKAAKKNNKKKEKTEKQTKEAPAADEQKEEEKNQKTQVSAAWANLDLQAPPQKQPAKKQQKKQEDKKQNVHKEEKEIVEEKNKVEEKPVENNSPWNLITESVLKAKPEKKVVKNVQVNKVEEKHVEEEKPVEEEKVIEEPKEQKVSPYLILSEMNQPYDDSKTYYKVPPELRRTHVNAQQTETQAKQQKPKKEQKQKKEQKPKAEKKEKKPKAEKKKNTNAKKQKKEQQQQVPKEEKTIVEEEKPAAPVEEPKLNSWATIEGTYDDSKDVHKIPVELRRTHAKPAVEEEKKQQKVAKKDKKKDNKKGMKKEVSEKIEQPVAAKTEEAKLQVPEAWAKLDIEVIQKPKVEVKQTEKNNEKIKEEEKIPIEEPAKEEETVKEEVKEEEQEEKAPQELKQNKGIWGTFKVEKFDSKSFHTVKPELRSSHRAQIVEQPKHKNGKKSNK